MAFDWFRVDATFADHPKTLALEEHTNDLNAGMYVNRLWCWLTRFAPRGVFAKTLGPAVERACRWRGDPGFLMVTLETVGWLESVTETEWEFHDWWEKQRPIVEKAERDSRRKKDLRKKKRRADGARTARAEMRTSARTARVEEKTGEDETRRDETRQNEEDVEDETGAASAAASSLKKNGVHLSHNDNPGLAFWYAFQAKRRDLGVLRVEHAPPADSWEDLWSWYLAMEEKLGGRVGVDMAVGRFFRDGYWKPRDFPFAAFRKQWFEFDGRND